MTKIETEEQYDWAVSRVETLLPLVDEDTPKNDPNFIELELLSNLVADYSDAHFAIGKPSLADVLKLRMYEMGLSAMNLSEMLQVSPARMSDFLAGKREPTLRVARAMSRMLHIDANIVLGL